MIVSVLGALLTAGAVAQQPSSPPTHDAGPYERATWNELHRALLARVDATGREHGIDALDPLLWPGSTYLLREPRLSAELAALDAFIAGEQRERCAAPLQRALLQRDLWSVFDWLAARLPASSAEAGAQRALANRIAHAIAVVALPADVIAALPDSYATAELPHLPAQLFDATGPWVELTEPTTSFEQPIAPAHAHQTAGRSVFTVHLSVPGGRAATLAYVDALARFAAPRIEIDGAQARDTRDGSALVLNPATPQPPVGSQVALARRALLVSSEGALVRSPLVENVQVRTFTGFGDVPPRAGELYLVEHAKLQHMAEFELDRRAFLRSAASGLREIEAEETAHALLLTHGGDPLDEDAEHAYAPPRRLEHCIACHGAPGIFSVQSYTGMHTGPGTHFLLAARQPRQLAPAHPDGAEAVALRFKSDRYDWGLLRGWMLAQAVPTAPGER